MIIREILQAPLRRALAGLGIVLIAICALLPFSARMQEKQPDYRNAQLSTDRRVADLLSRMTIDEKVAQMQTLWVRKPQERKPNGNLGDRGDFSAAEAAVVMKYGSGEIARQRERPDASRVQLGSYRSITTTNLDVVSSVTRPVKELKDFKRITLNSGESKTVSFVITPDKLSFLDLNMNRIVEPGTFEIMVGASSAKTQTAKLEVVAK